MSRGCKIFRSALLVALLCMAPVATSSTQMSVANDDTVAASPGLRPEVRLRKLHLVRPDLIQYPIAFEIYC
jgi:hypothetical protein